MRFRLILLLLSLAAPLVAADPPPLTAERFAQIVERLEAGLGVLTTPAALTEWTRTARFATWAGANASTMTEIATPEAAAARAAEIRAEGFNAVMVSGRHYRQSHRDPASMEQIMKSLRLAADACHAEGLRVIDHNDLTVFWSGAYPQVFQNPDWVQVDVTHGTPLRWFCLTNPDFIADAIAYLRRLLNETGVDGFMTDEVAFRPESCGCVVCRDTFERDTGYRLPEDSSSPVLFNSDDPVWRLWQHWRSVSVRRFHRQIVAALQDRPEVLWLGYSTAFTGPGAGDGGADIFQRAQVVNYPGYEAINTTFPAALHLHSELRVRLGVYRAHNRFGWAQFPVSSGSEEELHFAAMLAAVTGHASWTSSRTRGLGAIFNLERWQHLTTPRDPAADVAVIFSPATRDGGGPLSLLHEAELLGFSQALLRRGVAYEVLIDAGLTPLDLMPFRVIMVPAVDALSPRLAQALAAFAEGGGGVVVSGDVARRDPYGFDALDNPLRQSFGLEEAAPLTPPPPRKPSAPPDPLPAAVQWKAAGQQGIDPPNAVPFKDLQIYRTRFASLQPGQVLATFDAHPHPAAVMRPLGRGRLVHLAFLPGRAVYEPKLAVGAKITRRSDPAVDALIESLVLAAAGGPVASVKGEGVMSSVFAAPGRRVVHLLNIGGIQLPAHGEILERASGVPNYPPVGPVQITLRCAARSAHLHSLDANEPLQLGLKHDNNGLIRIEVPADSFQRYATVEVTE